MTSPSTRQLKRSWRYASPGVLLKNEIAGDPRRGSNYAKEYHLLRVKVVPAATTGHNHLGVEHRHRSGDSPARCHRAGFKCRQGDGGGLNYAASLNQLATVRQTAVIGR